jgi:membrane peptidoglycan carboxypeptidase
MLVGIFGFFGILGILQLLSNLSPAYTPIPLMMPDGFQIRSMHENGSSRVRRRWRRKSSSRAALGSALGAAAGAVAGGGRWVVRQKQRLGWKRFLLRAAGLGVFLGILYFAFLWFTLPNINDPASLLASQSTIVTDRNGVELYRLFSEQDRTYVTTDKIADPMKKAIVAIEDQRFYQHGCIEPRSILRAIFARFTGRSVTGGASTITQQLATNALLSREHSLTRKIREAMLSCELEQVYSKDKILELYLNWIPFGQNAYGVEQASRYYFGVAAKDLTLAQAATLASLPQRPSYFTPYGSHVRTTLTAKGMKKAAAGKVKTADDFADGDLIIGLLGNTVGTGSVKIYVGGRTDQVLKNMQDQTFITEQERLAAVEQLKAMTFKPLRENIRAPYFVLWVKNQVESLLEKNADKGLLEQGGLTIQTTLDWKLQQAAEAAVNARKDDIKRIYQAHNIALVALDPKTREVLAYVGNSDYSSTGSGTQIDMAQAPRQPGSSFKPFVYSAAFQKGYGPATPVYDVPTKFGEDQPSNFDGNFWGVMTARQALGASRNIPAIKAFFLAGGEQNILDLTEQMGVPSPKARKAELNKGKSFDYGWPLAIGAAETPLVEMVNGYGTIADGGIAKPVTSIMKITDKRGALLPLPTPPTDAAGEQALDPRIAYEITSILSDVSVRPNQFWQDILSVPGFQAAAKTGTSNKCLDRNETNGVCKVRKPDNLWTIGYIPDLVAGVWVGNANSQALPDKADGLNVAAPIWKDFMNRATKIIQVNAHDFPVPSGIVTPQISTLSGLLPAECTPLKYRRPDVFLSENAPTQADTACETLMVDRVTGLLASDTCPAEAQESRGFFLPSSILAERWPSWEQGVQSWARGASTGTGWSLPLPLPPTEKCDLSKTPGRLIAPHVTITDPADGGTASYPAFQPKITFSVGGSASGLTILLDGKVVDQLTSPPYNPVIRVPRSIAKEGLHTLKVTLTDNYYNAVSDEVTIRFSADASAPLVRLSEPAQGTTVRSGSGVTMRAEAMSAAGVKYVEFYLDSTLLTRKPKEPYELTYPVNLPPGQHVIKAVVTDFADKSAADQVTITVQ